LKTGREDFNRKERKESAECGKEVSAYFAHPLRTQQAKDYAAVGCTIS
jgi:hypothetical protein